MSETQKLTVTREELKQIVRELMQEIAEEKTQQQHQVQRLNPDIAVLLRLAFTRQQHPAAVSVDIEKVPRSVWISPTASADFDRLPATLAQSLQAKAKHVAAYAHLVEHQRLHADWPGIYHIGIGTQRVVYSLSEPEPVLSIETVRTRQYLFEAIP